MNITDWFNFFAFDVMGDLAFGKSFNMLRDGIKHDFVSNLHTDMKILGSCSSIPGLWPLMMSIPLLNAQHLKFWAWVCSLLEERKRVSCLPIAMQILNLINALDC